MRYTEKGPIDMVRIDKNRLKRYYRERFLGFGLLPIKRALDLTTKKIFKTESVVKKCEGCSRGSFFN